MKTVVIPARNEADSIASLVKLCRKHGAELVVVADDSSTDDTADRARTGGALVFPVPSDRRGLVGVYQAGVSRALREGATQIVELDAGGSHDPASLPMFWAALERYEVAAGTRMGVGGEYHSKRSRRWLSWVGTVLTNILHGSAWTDATSGFMGYTRKAATELVRHSWKSTGHFYQTEVRILCGARFTCCEVPIIYRGGRSSLRLRAILEAARLSVLFD